MIKKVVRNLDDLKLMYETLKPLKMLGCDTETTDLDIEKMDLVGVGIGSNSKLFYVPWSYKTLKNDDVIKVFNALFKKPIIFHNAKFDLKVLAKFGFNEPNDVHDSMIMAWLADETTNNGLKFLAKTVLNREAKEYKEVQQQVNLFHDAEAVIDEMGSYCMEDVRNTCDIYSLYKRQLEEENIWPAYVKLEKPMVGVLSRMETRGIKVDVVWLKQKKEEAEEVLKDLERRIYEVIGKDKLTFNLGSPQQLEALLFDELGYKTVKMTDKGKRSTDNESLNEIIKENKLGDDDFVPLLLHYRDMSKLHSTYLVGLLEQAGTEGVVHGSFLQHGTRTGRLSSREPNLQNIPARHDDWDVRVAFVPREGYRFVIGDYSQVELRVLAHFSQDEHMVGAFNEDFDIHAKTMEVTGITERRVAKAINFGLVYGMGPRRLAQQLDISEKEASEYIDKFFRGYPKVKPFISSVQYFAKQHGYIPMLTGRRRRFISENSRQWWGEVQRQSINTKIQGSAADIMKIAMLRLDKVLREYDAHQLIQVHDEIIVEAPIDRAEEVKKVVKETMESAVKLIVPLKSEPFIADYWTKG